ncbi:hypothetical protein EDM80_06525 [bacterium]|nr:MAG: hypothetical protein EDM80_06525 [bacterium]RIK62690.1 MAG: hypothetical protein DCC64_09020 [Planctomycetota bacterium]
MKRLSLLLLGLLCACTSQRRPEHDEPNFEVQPAPERPAPASDRVHDLLTEARRQAEGADYDEARITLHQIFRRDRWHPEANRLYQDVELKRGQDAALYREYLDLYTRAPRGDALWFHLRPLLIKRGFGPWPAQAEPAQSKAEYDRIEAALFLQRPADLEEDIRALKALLSMRLTAQQKLRLVERWFGGGNDGAALQDHWAQALEEDPGNGDLAALLSLTLHRASPPQAGEALKVAREAWILELPGILLPLALGQAALKLYEAEPGHTVDSARSRAGYALTAWHFLKLAQASGLEAAVQGLARLAAERDAKNAAFEDLTRD